MGITIPGYLQWVSYLAGQEWPQGDETAMFRIGDDWRSSAGELKDLIPDLNRVRSETESMFTGETARKVDEEFAKLFDGDYSLDKLAEAMSALGDLAQGCGTEIEYTKLQIIATLAIAAAEIAFALAASPETFGASLGVIPGIEALTIAAVRQFVSQLLRNIVEHLAEAGLKTVLKRLAVHIMADGLGQELAIQGFQIAEGHRHGFDAKQLANAELSALAGGLAAAPVSRGVGHALGPATGRVSGAIKGGVSGYAGGVAGNIAGTAATGGPMNAASILGGAVPGGLSGGVHGGRDGHGGGPDHGAGLDTWPTPERPAAPESNGSHTSVNGDASSSRTDPSALHGSEPPPAPQPHETAPHETSPHETTQPTQAGTTPSPDGARSSDPTAVQSHSPTSESLHAGDGPSNAGPRTEAPASEQAAATHSPNAAPVEPGPEARQSASGPVAGDPAAAGASTSGPPTSATTNPSAGAPSTTPPSHAAPTERPTATPPTRASLSEPSSAPTSGRPEGSPVAHTSDRAPSQAPSRETSEAPRSTSSPETSRLPVGERGSSEAPRRALDERPSPEPRRETSDTPTPTRRDEPADPPRSSSPHDQPRDIRPPADPVRPTRRDDQPNAEAGRPGEPKRADEPRRDNADTRAAAQSEHPRSEHDGPQRSDSERHMEPGEPHDMSTPTVFMSPVLHGIEQSMAHTGATETRAIPLDKPAAGSEARPSAPDAESTRHVQRSAMARPPEEIHLDTGGPPGGGGPTDPPHFDNPANHRLFGPHELRRLEDPAYHHAVEAALRDPRGGYTLHADPRTHPYGDLINDGGPGRIGRDNNCLDCSLAALASFHGQPTVAVPRHLDRLPNGHIDRGGEVSGLIRAESWLGEPLRSPDWRLPIPDQFAALHDRIAQMGPGSSALVVNSWHARDGWGQPLYHPDGTPVVESTHATVVVYPRDATGPVWWDPQHRVTFDRPAASMIGRSAYLHFTPIPPDHFGPVEPRQGGQHAGAEHPGAGTRLPGDDLAGHPLPRVPLRDGLGVHPDPESRGGGLWQGAGTGEHGPRLGDGSSHVRGEPGGLDDRGGVRGGETHGSSGRLSDLSPSVADHSAADQRGSGDHRVSDDRGLAGDSAGADGRASDHGGQGEPTERSAGRAVDGGGVLRGLEQSAESRDLARAGHDGVLDGHGHQPPPPGSGGDHTHHDDPGERWRDIDSFHDAEHAHEVANGALTHRIPPVDPIDLRHPLGEAELARQRATDNAHWWHGLSGEQQRALIDTYPHEIGNSEGIPPSARHEANSSVLEHDRAHLQSRRDAGEHLSRSENKELNRLNKLHDALEEARAGAARLGGEVHILAFDPNAFRGEGRMVVSVGHDPYRAESVSWHVPGLTTTIDSLPTNLENALHHLQSTHAEKPGIAASSIAWIGYDAPSGRGSLRVLFQGLAREGGAILHSDLSSFNAGRDVAAGDGSRFHNNHVFAHSYGSTTTSHAGRDARMRDDIRSITLLGSPGAGPQRHASDFGVDDRVFVASSSRDPVTTFGGRVADSAGRFFGHGLGMDPAMRDFGARRITSEFPRHMDTLGSVSTHTAYYHFDPESGHRTESLTNFGRIGAGHFDEVHTEQHRTVDDRPRWLPGWRTDEPAMGRPLEGGPHQPDSLDRRPWDPRWHSGYEPPAPHSPAPPGSDPQPPGSRVPGWEHLQSAAEEGPGWTRLADEAIDPSATPHGQPRSDWDPHHPPFDPHLVNPDLMPLWTDHDAPYGRAPDGTRYTEPEYGERFHKLGPEGQHWLIYPPNAGAASHTILSYSDAHQFVQDFGNRVDRLGPDGGKYLAVIENGVPARVESRSLHFESLYAEYHEYRLVPEKLPPEWTIRVSEAAPAMGQPGGCVQLVIFDSLGNEVPVKVLLDPDNGVLEK